MCTHHTTLQPKQHAKISGLLTPALQLSPWQWRFVISQRRKLWLFCQRSAQSRQSRQSLQVGRTGQVAQMVFWDYNNHWGSGLQISLGILLFIFRVDIQLGNKQIKQRRDWTPQFLWISCLFVSLFLFFIQSSPLLSSPVYIPDSSSNDFEYK